MLDRRPPRRDPRPLVVALAADTVTVASLDAWEVRALATLPARVLDEPELFARRLQLQVRPTHVLVLRRRARPNGSSRASVRALRSVFHRAGVPVFTAAPALRMRIRRGAPTVEALCRAYPELGSLSLTTTARALRAAAVLLLDPTLPPRRYASSTRAPHA